MYVQYIYSNGKGTYTFFGGYKIIGKWKDSKIWNGKEYDKNGNIKYKYVNGKRIKT